MQSIKMNQQSIHIRPPFQVLFVPQLLFAGFFVAIKEIPVWIRWAQYLCSLKYSINLVLIAEMWTLPRTWNTKKYSEDLYYTAVYGCPKSGFVQNVETGESVPISIINGVCNDTRKSILYNENAIFPKSEMDPSQTLVYVGIMLGILIVFRSIAMVLLVRRSRII